MPNIVSRLRDGWRQRYWQPTKGSNTFAHLRPCILITGGSQGLGAALAREFTRSGQPLVLVARDPEALKSIADDLGKSGAEVHILAADLANPAGRDAIEAALSNLGAYVDVLVNNAAIGLGGPFIEHAPGHIDRLVELNMGALTNLTRRFLPGMVVRGRGGVLNVASLGGFVPGPHQTAYYASKAYVISLTQALAHEVRGLGVRVSVLAPGPIATKFHARMGAEHSYYLWLIGVSSPERVARAAYYGFLADRTLIFPSLGHHLEAMALQILPRWLTVPVVGWMLQRRSAG
jgi:uncharacterized protein